MVLIFQVFLKLAPSLEESTALDDKLAADFKLLRFDSLTYGYIPLCMYVLKISLYTGFIVFWFEKEMFPL